MRSKTMEDRRQAISDISNQLGELRFTQLKEMFPEVSEVTLRKDLAALELEGVLIRTHGGVKSVPKEINFAFRKGLHQEEKFLIGRKAAKLVNENDSVFITAGTTCGALAQMLPTCNLNVVTDGLITATMLPCSPNVHAVMLGGEIDQNTQRVVDASILSQIEHMHFNVSFLGAPGFHPKYGYATVSPNSAAIFRKVIEHSDKTVMLLDSSKINYCYSPRVIPIGEVDILVSDDKLDEKTLQLLQSAGVQVL